MQIPRIGVALLGFGLALSLAHADTAIPPHPTGLFAEYRGQRYPVVGVEKEDPVVRIDGKKKRLRGNVPISSDRMPRYGEGKAELSEVKTEILQLVTTTFGTDVEQVKSNRGATVGGYVEFSSVITPREDLADCFIALIAFDQGFQSGYNDQPNAQIRLRQIQNLPAGKATRIQFSSTPFLSGKHMQIFVLLFAGGDEIATNTMSGAWPYFQKRERLVHASAVKQWLKENAAGNRPAQPILQIPPLFESTQGFPADAAAVLVVAPDGTVADISLRGELPAPAERVLTDTLGAWLFLPRIQDGAAETSRVTVPLKF